MNRINYLRAAKAKVAAAVAIAGAAAMSLPAHAAAIDVGDVVTEIGAQVAPIVLIGGAVLMVVVTVKAFRWVRSALS